MRLRRRLAWFWVLAPLFVTALGWASYAALTKERDAHRSRQHWARRSQLEEVARRLDAAVALTVARESALPVDAFASFSTGRTVVTGDPPQPLPSPLVRPPGILPEEAAELAGPLATGFRSGAPSPRLARLYLELVETPDGELTRVLPAAPTGEARRLALAQGLTGPSILARVEDLAEELERRVPAADLQDLARSGALPLQTPAQRSFSPVLFSTLAPPLGDPDAAAVPTAELLLLRLVDDEGTRRLQAVWFDWPSLHGALHALGATLVPEGELVVHPSVASLDGDLALPPRELVAGETGARLANLAIEVEVRGLAVGGLPLWTSTTTSLAGAMLVSLGALAALFVSLRRSEELATRRTRFASAVTHELRTPLTTLCMYAELLEAGLVRDPDQVATYHATLKRESQRLAGLIDNVLAHAGLGEGGGATVEPVDLGELLDGLEPRLVERCGRGDLAGAGNGSGTDGGVPALELDRTGLPAGTSVQADAAGLERVLVNLVDNACKYGAAPVRLAAAIEGGRAHLRVTDGGPGIPRRHRRRLFAPYDRGAAEAGGDRASRTSGLGLGLSLARDLCRAMGGDLVLEHPGPAGSVTGRPPGRMDGADRPAPTTFHLQLPLADSAPSP